MTSDEIRQKAREYRKQWSHKPTAIPSDSSGLWYSEECTDDLVTAFAESLVAAEREECAKIAEAHGNTIGDDCWNHENSAEASLKCWQVIAAAIRSRASQPAPANWVPHYPRLDEIIEEFQRLTRERKEQEKQDAGLRSGEGIQVLAEDGSDSGTPSGRSDNDVRVPDMAGEVNPAPHIHTANCYECGHDDCPCHGGYLHELPMCNPEPPAKPAEGPAAKEKP